MDYILTAALGVLAGGYLTWHLRARIQSIVDWFSKIGPPA
jgi:hypothetical protein